MQKLNFPSYSFRLRPDPYSSGGLQIFDIIRKKYISLTPEEWVRQHVIHYLIHTKKYPIGLMRVEGSLRYYHLRKRSDVMVYDRRGKLWMLIECKSPGTSLTTQAFRQLAIYNIAHSQQQEDDRAQYLAITNGLIHYCCKLNYQTHQHEFLNDFPEFPDSK